MAQIQDNTNYKSLILLWLFTIILVYTQTGLFRDYTSSSPNTSPHTINHYNYYPYSFYPSYWHRYNYNFYDFDDFDYQDNKNNQDKEDPITVICLVILSTIILCAGYYVYQTIFIYNWIIALIILFCNYLWIVHNLEEVNKNKSKNNKKIDNLLLGTSIIFFISGLSSIFNPFFLTYVILSSFILNRMFGIRI